MNWRRFLAAGLVVLGSTTLIGCELVSVNAERDNAQLVLRVNDRSYTKQKANELLDASLRQQNVEDVNAPEIQDSVFEWKKTTLTDSMAKPLVFEQEAVELGYRDKLSEEDKAQVDSQYNQMVEYYDVTQKQQLEEQYAEDPEKDRKVQEELDKQKQEFLENYEIDSMEAYRDVLIDGKAAQLYQTDLENAVTASDEEVSAEYQTRLEEQRNSYTTNPGAYVDSQETNVFVPEGVRNIKQVLIKFPEAVQNEMTQLQTRMSTLNSEGDTAGADEVQTQIDAKKADGLALIDSKANNVLRQAKAGADFDKLIEQYNEDPGMTAGSKGYLVAQGAGKYVSAFQDAAMALPQVGAISELVATDYGYHIMLYASDEPVGEVPFEQVKEAIRGELVAEKKKNVVSDTQNELMERYKREGKMEIYPERLKKAQVPGKN